MLEALLHSFPVTFISFHSPESPEWISPYFQIVWLDCPGEETELLFAPPGIPIRVKTTCSNYSCLSFESQLFLSMEELTETAQPVEMKATPHVRDMLRLIESLKAQPLSASCKIKLSSLVACLASEFMQYIVSERQTRRHDTNIKRKPLDLINGKSIIYATRYMKVNMGNPHLSLHDIAQSIGYHPNYFCQEFSKIFAVSPIRFLNRLRLNRTLRLLAQTEYTVKEICKFVGISDPSRLSRMVKSGTGMTPLEFRRFISQKRDGKGENIWQKFYLSMARPAGMSIRL
ncbi:hypothetical protein PAE9249_02169 [Paenibacillus sp. CECT 9249]|nr:hypothetical protein PAE9249_02169 [Paenibacillus sp. CECT 9249]